MNGSTGEKVVCSGGRLAGGGGGGYTPLTALFVSRVLHGTPRPYSNDRRRPEAGTRPSLTRLVPGGQRGSITLQIGLHESRPRRDSLGSLVVCLRCCGQFSFQINFLSSIGECCDVRARLSRCTERSRVKTAPTPSHGPPRVAASKYRRT